MRERRPKKTSSSLAIAYLFSSVALPFSENKSSSASFCQRSKQKSPLTERGLSSRTNKTDRFIRGATLIHGKPCAFGILTYPRTLTPVHTLQILGKKAFDCTLRGPFANLFLTRISASRALCEGITDVISASTVYSLTSISRPARFVNSFFDIF